MPKKSSLILVKDRNGNIGTIVDGLQKAQKTTVYFLHKNNKQMNPNELTKFGYIE